MTRCAIRIHNGGSASGEFRHEIQQAHPTQNRPTELCESLVEAALCLRLRNHQQERIRAVDGFVRQSNEVPLHIGEHRPAALEPVVDHRIGNVYPSQVFQGARLYERRSGIVRRVGLLVDDDAIQPELPETDRQRHTDRPGPDDQNVGRRRDVLVVVHRMILSSALRLSAAPHQAVMVSRKSARSVVPSLIQAT